MVKTLTTQDKVYQELIRNKKPTRFKSKLNTIIAQFSTETLKVQKVWNVFQVLKDDACQFRLLYPGQLSYGELYDEETKILHDQ